MPVIPALRRLRQEDHKTEVSLGYIVRLCLKKQSNQKGRCQRFFDSLLRELNLFKKMIQKELQR
jgi:hypothetical protein